MKFPFEDLEVVRSMSSIRWVGVWTHILWLPGAVFVIIGIVSGAMDARIGLDAIHWFLLAIAFFTACITQAIAGALAWYLRTTEPKKEE
jgi:sorbitol-specific phosphotransferase system component IIC